MNIDVLAAAVFGLGLARIIGQRDFAMDELRTMRAAFTEQERQLKNLERVARNPLYRDAIEDVQGNAVGAALHLRMLRESLNAAELLLKKERGK